MTYFVALPPQECQGVSSLALTTAITSGSAWEVFVNATSGTSVLIAPPAFASTIPPVLMTRCELPEYHVELLTVQERVFVSTLPVTTAIQAFRIFMLAVTKDVQASRILY